MQTTQYEISPRRDDLHLDFTTLALERVRVYIYYMYLCKNPRALPAFHSTDSFQSL